MMQYINTLLLVFANIKHTTKSLLSSIYANIFKEPKLNINRHVSYQKKFIWSDPKISDLNRSP